MIIDTIICVFCALITTILAQKYIKSRTIYMGAWYSNGFELVKVVWVDEDDITFIETLGDNKVSTLKMNRKVFAQQFKMVEGDKS